MVPSLIESIKSAGLVLVADTSEESPSTLSLSSPTASASASAPPNRSLLEDPTRFRMPEGVNGVLRGDGVLRFNEMIDM